MKSTGWSACAECRRRRLARRRLHQELTSGDFELWNELKRRRHEIMPHGYRHENLAKLPLDQAQELVRRCLGVFSEKLSGFDPKQALFNFPYNASTPELERWLPTQVRAFRTGGGAINPWPHRRTGEADLSSVRVRELRGCD